jgi:hypothetical protein
VALVAVALLKPGAVDSNSGTAEKHGVEPTYAEAETVKRHVLENAHDPASVEFVTWYPRLEGTGEPYRRKAAQPPNRVVYTSLFGRGEAIRGAALNAREPFNQGKPWVMVHVKLRGKNSQGALTLDDTLYYVSEGKVILKEDNDYKGEPVDPRDRTGGQR